MTYANITSLSESPILGTVYLAPSLNSFKNRLNKFWKSQSCIYNYKDNLTGTTNRSYTKIQE